jgi:hypothetical protein
MTSTLRVCLDRRIPRAGRADRHRLSRLVTLELGSRYFVDRASAARARDVEAI